MTLQEETLASARQIMALAGIRLRDKVEAFFSELDDEDSPAENIENPMEELRDELLFNLSLDDMLGEIVDLAEDLDEDFYDEDDICEVSSDD